MLVLFFLSLGLSNSISEGVISKQSISNPAEANGLFVGNLKVRILDIDLEEINWPDKAASKILIGTRVFTNPDFKSSALIEFDKSRNLRIKAMSIERIHSYNPVGDCGKNLLLVSNQHLTLQRLMEY